MKKSTNPWVINYTVIQGAAEAYLRTSSQADFTRLSTIITKFILFPKLNKMVELSEEVKLDIIQDCMVKLIENLRKYDESKGMLFTTYYLKMLDKFIADKIREYNCLGIGKGDTLRKAGVFFVECDDIDPLSELSDSVQDKMIEDRTRCIDLHLDMKHHVPRNNPLDFMAHIVLDIMIAQHERIPDVLKQLGMNPSGTEMRERVQDIKEYAIDFV